ncbi:hypothetical protein LCGC14_0464810 [marine sediment metagenome]|uniref:Uncharacterized protein n=1 Tax=marine sediment metagenome TaxID=412755 RepID=A0A0F9SJ98_9ZZZZ
MDSDILLNRIKDFGARMEIEDDKFRSKHFCSVTKVINGKKYCDHLISNRNRTFGEEATSIVFGIRDSYKTGKGDD